MWEKRNIKTRAANTITTPPSHCFSLSRSLRFDFNRDACVVDVITDELTNFKWAASVYFIFFCIWISLRSYVSYLCNSNSIEMDLCLCLVVSITITTAVAVGCDDSITLKSEWKLRTHFSFLLSLLRRSLPLLLILVRRLVFHWNIRNETGKENELQWMNRLQTALRRHTYRHNTHAQTKNIFNIFCNLFLATNTQLHFTFSCRFPDYIARSVVCVLEIKFDVRTSYISYTFIR